MKVKEWKWMDKEIEMRGILFFEKTRHLKNKSKN